MKIHIQAAVLFFFFKHLLQCVLSAAAVFECSGKVKLPVQSSAPKALCHQAEVPGRILCYIFISAGPHAARNKNEIKKKLLRMN